MASRLSQRLFFFAFGNSNSPLAAATVALPRFVASTTTGAPAAALKASLSLGKSRGHLAPRRFDGRADPLRASSRAGRASRPRREHPSAALLAGWQSAQFARQPGARTAKPGRRLLGVRRDPLDGLSGQRSDPIGRRLGQRSYPIGSAVSQRPNPVGGRLGHRPQPFRRGMGERRDLVGGRADPIGGGFGKRPDSAGG